MITRVGTFEPCAKQCFVFNYLRFVLYKSCHLYERVMCEMKYDDEL